MMDPSRNAGCYGLGMQVPLGMSAEQFHVLPLHEQHQLLQADAIVRRRMQATPVGVVARRTDRAPTRAELVRRFR